MDPTARVKALNEQRINIVNEQRTLLESIKPGDTRSAEQVEQLARQDTSISALDSEIREIVDRERREREAGQLQEDADRMFRNSGNREGRPARTQDVIKAYLSQPRETRGDLVVDVQNAMLERQMMRDGASPEEIRNAIAWDTGSIASAVPTTMARSLYQKMEASIAAFRLPTTRIPTASGENMDFPKVNAHAIASQVAGQGTTLAGTDPTFDKLTLGAKKYGELVKVSSESISDAVFDVGGFLGGNIGRAIGRLADTDLVLGSGGITDGLIDSGLGTVAAKGSTEAQITTAAANGFIDAVYGIVDEYRQGAAWLFRDATCGFLRKLRDGGAGTIGAYLWEPSLTNGLYNGQPDRFLGYPVYTDPNVASIASDASIGAFGDFSTYYLRTVGNVLIDSSADAGFATDEVWFRGKWRLDGGYVDTGGVVVIRARVS